MSRIRPVLKSVLLLNSTVMALVPLHAAHAQDRSRSTTLDEIVIMGVGETSDGGGLKLKRPASTASRLKMTPLQTPASVDVIDKETIAKRGQTDVVEAITQNATGVSSVAPEALGTAYAMRGFQGNNSVMQLYDGFKSGVFRCVALCGDAGTGLHPQHRLRAAAANALFRHTSARRSHR